MKQFSVSTRTRGRPRWLAPRRKRTKLLRTYDFHFFFNCKRIYYKISLPCLQRINFLITVILTRWTISIELHRGAWYKKTFLKCFSDITIIRNACFHLVAVRSSRMGLLHIQPSRVGCWSTSPGTLRSWVLMHVHPRI